MRSLQTKSRLRLCCCRSGPVPIAVMACCISDSGLCSWVARHAVVSLPLRSGERSRSRRESGSSNPNPAMLMLTPPVRYAEIWFIIMFMLICREICFHFGFDFDTYVPGGRVAVPASSTWWFWAMRFARGVWSRAWTASAVSCRLRALHVD